MAKFANISKISLPMCGWTDAAPVVNRIVPVRRACMSGNDGGIVVFGEQAAAEVLESYCGSRVGGEHESPLRFCCSAAAGLIKRRGHCHMGLDRFWIEQQRLPERIERVFGAAIGIETQPEEIVVTRRFRLQSGRCAEDIGRASELLAVGIPGSEFCIDRSVRRCPKLCGDCFGRRACRPGRLHDRER